MILLIRWEHESDIHMGKKNSSTDDVGDVGAGWNDDDNWADIEIRNRLD